MMRILIVTHYFPPEIGAPQARLSEMAKTWVEAGADVTVLTGMPNHPDGVIPVQYRGAVRRTEWVDGYRVLRTWLYATPNEGFLKKTLSHLSFMFSSVILGGRRSGSVDVVLVSSPTFFSIGSAWLLARVKRARLIVEVRDLWPAIFIDLGVLTSPSLIRLLERLELAAYHAADAVVTVTESFRNNISRRGIPAEKVHVISNGVDLRRFNPSRAPQPEIRPRLGAGSDDTLVLYIGAHGISQGLAAVVDAAAELRDDPIRIAFVGEGADKRRVAGRVAQLGLSNVTMLPAVPRSEVPGMLAAADVCLVTLRDIPLFRAFIPSKMFELMAAQRPIVGSVAGEAADILTAAGAVVVPPESPGHLAAALRKLAANAALRETVAVGVRRFVEQRYDRSVLAHRYLDLMRSLTKEPRP